MRYFPQATIQKYVSSLLRVSCQGEILTPIFFFTVNCEHPSYPKGPLENISSSTYPDSTERALPRSCVRHGGDKQPRASPRRWGKTNKAKSKRILGNDGILPLYLLCLCPFPPRHHYKDTHICFILVHPLQPVLEKSLEPPTALAHTACRRRKKGLRAKTPEGLFMTVTFCGAACIPPPRSGRGAEGWIGK